MNAKSDTSWAGARGQTSIDFAIGASVFLLTVAFVVAFLPGTFEPFTDSGAEDVVVADRTADLLAEQLLVAPTAPGVLDEECTAEFFDAEGDGPGGLSDCGYTTDAADLDTALGLGSGLGANVTIEENNTVQSVTHDGSSVSLAAGPELPDRGSVVVSRRVVLLDGEGHDIYVRVW